MSKVPLRAALRTQSELSIALSALFFAGSVFALLSSLVFPAVPPRPNALVLTVAGVAAVAGAITLFIGGRVTLFGAGFATYLYVATLLLLVTVSATATRALVPGALIIVMVMHYAWFMRLWATRLLAVLALSAYAVLMILRFPSNDTMYVVTVIFVLCLMLIEVFGRFRVRLQNASLTDHLCQVWNRAGLEALLTREIRAHQRTGEPLALLYIDLDEFKLINDERGHQAGDAVLQSLAHALTQNVRPGDTVARVGGDEFVLILPHTSVPEAQKLATRLQTAADECAWTFGAAQFRRGETAGGFLERSDRELIARKQARKGNAAGAAIPKLRVNLSGAPDTLIV